MDGLFTLATLRPLMQAMFPEVEDERDDNETYEHPMTAVGLVLLSAAIMGTSETGKLRRFTGYSSSFIAAITLNMQNNELWIDGKYDATTWLSSSGTINQRCLWDHIEIACGGLWLAGVNSHISANPCNIYWDERGGFQRASM